MHVKRLRELCAHLGLPDVAERRLGLLLELLEHDPEAPTSVTDPAESVDVHVADSLSALPLLRPFLRGAGPVVAIVDGNGGVGDDFAVEQVGMVLPRDRAIAVHPLPRPCERNTGVLQADDGVVQPLEVCLAFEVE